MMANFEDSLKIKSDGKWLEACGPLLWGDERGPEPADKVTVAVTITQNGVVVHGTTHECDAPQDEWMINLRAAPGQKFQAGKTADAIGTLTITDPLSDPPQTLGWRQTVNIVPA